MKHRQFRSKYLEINIKPKQHLALEFLPYGFGYDNPLIILKLFIISFYIKLPFKIKDKDSDIDYGFQFYDIDEPHWFPDCLRLSFGKYVKCYDMPWFPVLFEIKYDSKVISGDLAIKDIDRDENGIIMNKARIELSNGDGLGLKYYKETRILKCKVFGRFIEFGRKDIYVLNVDYDRPNFDLSEKGLVGDMMFLENDMPVKDAFRIYCKKNNLTVL
jgi:hypothetical protein